MQQESRNPAFWVRIPLHPQPATLSPCFPCSFVASEPVLLVSCADKIENLNAIRKDRERVGEAVWGRFRRGRDHQAW